MDVSYEWYTGDIFVFLVFGNPSEKETVKMKTTSNRKLKTWLWWWSNNLGLWALPLAHQYHHKQLSATNSSLHRSPSTDLTSQMPRITSRSWLIIFQLILQEIIHTEQKVSTKIWPPFFFLPYEHCTYHTTEIAAATGSIYWIQLVGFPAEWYLLDSRLRASHLSLLEVKFGNTVSVTFLELHPIHHDI